MTDEEIVANLNKAFEKMMNAEVPETNFTCFANKIEFHAILEHYYIVLGTRLMVHPAFLNKKWKKHHFNDFCDLMNSADIDQAEFYKTRNEAKRAVSRNRQGYIGPVKTQSHKENVRGIDVVLVEPARFECLTTIKK